jgi:glycosyltransferase involved in cell wall biosynthesis
MTISDTFYQQLPAEGFDSQKRELEKKLLVSVVIPVLNEEKNLADCLSSVEWADQVFVVDSHSSDRTVSIAEEYGATVVQFNHRPGGLRKKNWSLKHLPFRNEWIFLLDADERVTPSLQAEIVELMRQGPRHQGYYVNRKQIFLGTWLRHGGNYPSWNLRLLRRGAGRYEQLDTEELESAGNVEIHEHMVVEGTTGYLHEPLLHMDFKDLHQFIDRHNRYSTWDAKMRSLLRSGSGFSNSIHGRLFGSPVERKRFLKRLLVHLPCRPLLRFLYMYVLRAGFLDGRAGLIYALFKAVQEFHINCKQYEASLLASSQLNKRPASKLEKPCAPDSPRLVSQHGADRNELVG